MTQQLWLIRHAQAADSGFSTPDKERKLTEYGRQTARKLGQHLHQISPDFQRIISSDAQRAQETATLLAGQYSYELSAIRQEPKIYEATVRTFLQIINDLDSIDQRVMIIGHNPTISYLAEYLTNGNVGPFSPGTAALLAMEGDDWNLWSSGSAALRGVVHPHHLGD